MLSKSEVKEQLEEILTQAREAKGTHGTCSWIAFWDLVNLVREIIEEGVGEVDIDDDEDFYSEDH